MPSEPIPPSNRTPDPPASSFLSDPEHLFDERFATAGLCILDSQYRYVWLNQTLAGLHRIAIGDHLGKTVGEVMGDLAKAMEPHLAHVTSTGEPVLDTYVSFTLPLEAAPVRWTQHYFPVCGTGNKVTCIGVVTIETTEKGRLEKAVHSLDLKLRKEKNWLQAVLDVSRLLSSNWDIPMLFPTISAQIRRVLRQEYASFALYHPESNTFVRQAVDFPMSKGLLFTAAIDAQNNPASHAIRESTPVILSRKDLQSFDAEVVRSILAEGMESLCCVPLVRPNGPLGILVLASTREDAFEASDLNLLNHVGAQLALAIENHRAASEIKHLRQRLGDERKYLESDVDPHLDFPEIVGNSKSLQQVLQQIVSVASSEATVLILGETGTGKELVAQAIHRLSQRHREPFIKVNCAAIPTGLLESELFGHEKGAFTGAVSQKIGRMELADGGTLFLDEIGEIRFEIQPKLLRVLQDQEFERLGSNRTIKVNLRVIAATNRNLAESIAQRQFRSDLYYRLSVFPISVPPLRERREDIPALARHFVHRSARRLNRYIETIPKETMEALSSWH